MRSRILDAKLGRLQEKPVEVEVEFKTCELPRFSNFEDYGSYLQNLC